VTVVESPAAEGTNPNYAENPPAPPHPSSLLRMLSLQMPQLLELHKNNLQIRKLPLNLQQSYLPHHHTTRPPSPSNLVRVVARIKLQRLLQLQLFQPLSKKL